MPASTSSKISLRAGLPRPAQFLSFRLVCRQRRPQFLLKRALSFLTVLQFFTARFQLVQGFYHHSNRAAVFALEPVKFQQPLFDLFEPRRREADILAII